MIWQVLSCKKVEWQHLLHFGNTLGRQDIPKRRWVLTLVASFRLSVPSSLSVFLPVTPVCVGKEGRQVLSCKKMGWKLWPEVIIVRYTVPYCTPYCTSVPHRTTLVLFAEVITPVTSCAPRQHPSILPHPSQHSEFKICFDFSKYLFFGRILLSIALC